MKLTNEQLKLAADTVRCRCADIVDKAKSGHPGGPMGQADLAVSLWLKFLNIFLVWLCWYLMTKRKMSPTVVMGLLVVVALVGVLLGFFDPGLSY